jgi:oxygen-independent coproporphyrinogen-3 oxidase
LAFFGRDHKAVEGLKALELVNGIFDNTTFDLIWGRPGQTVDSWKAELGNALKYAGDHVSLYQLTVERGTK